MAAHVSPVIEPTQQQISGEYNSARLHSIPQIRGCFVEAYMKHYPSHTWKTLIYRKSSKHMFARNHGKENQSWKAKKG